MSSIALRGDDAVGPDNRTLKEACQLLTNCTLFAGLSADERAAVVALARIRTFNAGETIFSIGSPGDQMMALLSGAIRISVTSSDGKELLLAIIRPGEVFGELAILDNKERSADAVAETACTVAMLDRHDILSFFERNPSAWPNLVKVLCQRLRHTDQVFAEVALLHLREAGQGDAAGGKLRGPFCAFAAGKNSVQSTRIGKHGVWFARERV